MPYQIELLMYRGSIRLTVKCDQIIELQHNFVFETEEKGLPSFLIGGGNCGRFVNFCKRITDKNLSNLTCKGSPPR